MVPNFLVPQERGDCHTNFFVPEMRLSRFLRSSPIERQLRPSIESTVTIFVCFAAKYPCLYMCVEMVLSGHSQPLIAHAPSRIRRPHFFLSTIDFHGAN